MLFDGYLLDAAAMSAGGKAVAAHPLDVVVQVIEQIRKSGTVNFSLLGDQELPPLVRPFGSAESGSGRDIKTDPAKRITGSGYFIQQNTVYGSV